MLAMRVSGPSVYCSPVPRFQTGIDPEVPVQGRHRGGSEGKQMIEAAVLTHEDDDVLIGAAAPDRSRRRGQGQLERGCSCIFALCVTCTLPRAGDSGFTAW